tara:strand:- start:63301 stop:63771 length:471 start_codon:yes stop_codon:yes gene_type:complete
MKFVFLILVILSANSISAQNLLKERIWKISDRKRSIFFDKGVFHSDLKASNQMLQGVRNSYVSARGYERVVFDFASQNPPKVYGYISEDNKIYIDFFNTVLEKAIEPVSGVKYVKGINFYNIDSDGLSAEITFKSKVSVDIFYLSNPGRIVIDIKK